MNLELSGRAALVLASSSGLGKGIATELAREGAQVMLFSTNEEKLRQAQQEIERLTGNRPEYLAGSVLTNEDISRAVAETVARFGALDVLVANTGGPKAGRFDSLEPDDWENAFRLCLFSYVRAIREALPHMRKHGGHILCTTSSSVKQALDNLILSNTFRMGVVGMVKTIARELAQEGILINAIGAGIIDTPRIEQLNSFNAARNNLSPADWRRRQEAGIPMQRYGGIDEFGRLAAFLCSRANSYVTGQSIVVDGGMTTAY